MDDVKDLTFESLDNYFKTLITFGYKSYPEVDKLLILTFIEELMSGRFDILVEECEYKSIMNALYCLFGSTCLIPYPQFIANTPLINPYLTKHVLRITEDDLPRITETEYFRALA